MRTNSELRAAARQRLSGRWGIAVGVTLIASVILYLLRYINSISTLMSTIGYSFYSSSYLGPRYVITSLFRSISNSFGGFFGIVIDIVAGGAIAYGLAAFNLELSRCGNVTVGTLFEGFRRCFGKSIIVNILRQLFIILWVLLVTIVTVVLSVALFLIPATINNEIFMILVGFFIFIFVIAVFLVAIIIINRYALVYYLMRDCDEADAMAYIRQSKVLMKGKSVQLMWLQISFFGWTILSAFTLGIGSLFLTPYVNASIAQFYEDCLSEGRINGKMIYLRVRGEGMDTQGYGNPYQNPGSSQYPGQNQGYDQNPYQGPYDNNNQ